MSSGAFAAHDSAASSDDLLLARVRVAVAGRYDGLREIGRGGMAVVYAAHDRRLNRDVAIKVLPPDLAFRSDIKERFLREAQTAARLNHPGIVPIYSVDEAEGLVFFVMALVEGESLANRLSREPRPPLSFVRQVLYNVADSLAYAHASGVVHRDIKPDNILLEKVGGRPIVTDFGIARAAESGIRLTQTGIAVGTPAFMSPEQATGNSEVDGRSDVYSLGVVGYVMLAGRLPFEASSSAGMLVEHVKGKPFPLANFRADLPFSITDAIMRAISREPASRWPDAASFASALRAGEAEDSEGKKLRQQLQQMLNRDIATVLPTPEVTRVRSAYEQGKAENALKVIGDWKRRIEKIFMSSIATIGGVVILEATGAEMIGASFMLGGMALFCINSVMFVRDSLRMKDVGISMRDAIGERWRDKIAAMGSHADVKVGGRLELPSKPSRHSRALREAEDDRNTVRSTLEKLDAADRDLVPDASAAAEALFERIVSLLAHLERIEDVVEPGAMALLETRIREMKLNPSESADYLRRLNLMERQLASMVELDDRRSVFLQQFEATSLALRTLRLDMVRLRELGVGSAMRDVSSVTQEARAVSLDINRALEIADEIRKI